MQRLVKGATKPKVAAPKAKYIEPLLESTFGKGPEFEQVMDALSRCLGRSITWSTSYKALIVLHIMIREGQQDVVLRFLSRHPRMLELDDEVARQAAGLGRYARYLGTRASQFKDTKIDYVRYKSKNKTRLFNLSVDKGLLRECESVIIQIDALIKCHFDERDVDNDVTLMAFRLLVHDLLSLFQVLNEGVINLLEHFFELSSYDAEHALEVYKGFTRLTSKVIAFLKVAKNLEYQTKLHVPNIKHAPTSLVSSLEVYLNDPDFEMNRRQYLAEKQAHKSSRADLRNNNGSGHSNDLKRQPTLIQQAQQAQDRDVPLSQIQSQLQQQQQSQLLQQQQQQQPMPSFSQSSQPTQAQHQQPMQSIHDQQQQAPRQVDLLTGDVVSPYYQVQAAQIQLQQDQAQLQLQQMIQQQQQQQQELQRQQSMGGFNFQAQPSQVPPQSYSQQPQQQAPQQQAVYTGGMNMNPQMNMHQTMQPQLTGQHTGQTNIATQHTGGMSSFNFGQSAPQQAAQSNPFKRNSVPTQSTGHNPFHRQNTISNVGQPYSQQQTMPFQSTMNTGGYNPVAQQQYMQQPQQQQQQQPVVPQGTGRNPFRTSMQ